MPRYLVERLLLDTSGYLQHEMRSQQNGALPAHTDGGSRRLADAGYPVPAVEAMARYRWVGEMLDGVVEGSSERPVTWSDKLDRVLTHRWWGTLVFAVVMLVDVLRRSLSSPTGR